VKAQTFVFTAAATLSFTADTDIVLDHGEIFNSSASPAIVSTNPTLTNAILVGTQGVRDDVIAKLGCPAANGFGVSGNLNFDVPKGTTIFVAGQGAAMVVILYYRLPA
jgi:hypothetical protein